MLDCIYHMALKLIKNHIFAIKKTPRFWRLLCNIIMDVIMYCCEICKRLVVYLFYSMAFILHSLFAGPVLKTVLTALI